MRTWGGPPFHGTTFGWPVQPVPHQSFFGPVWVSADIAQSFVPFEGKVHRSTGSDGTGPSP